jgi:hypothetical protein
LIFFNVVFFQFLREVGSVWDFSSGSRMFIILFPRTIKGPLEKAAFLSLWSVAVLCHPLGATTLNCSITTSHIIDFTS